MDIDRTFSPSSASASSSTSTSTLTTKPPPSLPQPLPSPSFSSSSSTRTASTQSSASTIRGAEEKPKKFKLDPMSLLLPHERLAYAAQQRQPSAQPTSVPLSASGSGSSSGGGVGGRFPPLPQAQHVGQPSFPNSTGGTGLGIVSGGAAVRGMQGQRQTVSMGEQSGQKGETSQAYPVQMPVPSQALPISPPSSLMSTPPPSQQWDASSATSSAAWSSMDGLVESSSVASSSNWSHPNQPRYYPPPASLHSKVRLEDWEIVETLGTGTFGRVLLVRQRPSYRPTPYHPIFPHLFQSLDPLSPSPSVTQQSDNGLPHFAMKVLKKSEIVRLKQVEHINSERMILERVRHPFVVELYATYQDQLNVYMLLSYIPGGELFSHLRRAGRFSADVTRFYLASIVMAIEYLHSHDIIYRDLKPENLLLDRHGYLRIADFGFAKIVEDRTFTLCGTPEYLAPEIVLSQGHGKAVDWWALGILAFEMLAGYPPFFDDHPLGIYEKILRGDIAFPSHIDPYAKDLIRGLLTADRSKRLGNLRGGARDVMNHAWFAGVDWRTLERKEIGAPIVPRVASMGDSQNFQRYPPPRPHDLPGIFGQPYDITTDQYGELFKDFSFPPGPESPSNKPMVSPGLG
ncbi:AGC/PKA protein kinase [Kwoniella heveanensis BCC8398]|uniref:cAMP-dependent protein kinase n=1 Tax=Kwoniella heveanensis BCC8398 TaxID=1296120 RepID=A0A1B9GM61_9TREE|nr:AGC/PKA protein kinase [Kwoniella heveanensis BCC8398]